jgi:hypothetical protein
MARAVVTTRVDGERPVPLGRHWGRLLTPPVGPHGVVVLAVEGE